MNSKQHYYLVQYYRILTLNLICHILKIYYHIYMEKSNPKISVIVPVYNVEQYLRRCIGKSPLARMAVPI